jgi:branched-chain amino acid aminotransferase
MAGWVNFNGSFLTDETPIVSAANRGLRYGEGVFETMRSVNAEIRLKDFHFERLFTGMELLQMSFSKQQDKAYFEEQVYKTISKNKLSGAARIRLMVFRGDGAAYETDAPGNFVVQCQELPGTKSLLNENGLRIAIYQPGRKSCDAFSGIKSNNYLLYSMAAAHAKQYQYDDCVVLNMYDRICDSSISNVFWIKNEVVHTPPLSEGCIAGVMRRHLLRALPAAGFAVTEQPATIELLEDADELFLTNAISGMRWVGSFNGKDFQNTISTGIFHSIISSE